MKFLLTVGQAWTDRHQALIGAALLALYLIACAL